MASFLNALLLLMVASAAAASAHTTVVTTTVVSEEEPCAAEMQQKMPLRMCAMWMKSKIGLDECCAELARFNSGCRCDAVKAVEATSVRYGPMEEMRRRACSLPGKCRGLSHCSCSGDGDGGGGGAFFA